jgi:hypothetical protein
MRVVPNRYDVFSEVCLGVKGKETSRIAHTGYEWIFGAIRPLNGTAWTELEILSESTFQPTNGLGCKVIPASKHTKFVKVTYILRRATAEAP